MDPVTALAPARSALEAVGRRTADLIRSLPDLNRPVTGSQWTVRETAAHLVSQAGVFTDVAAGMPSPIKGMTAAVLRDENARRLGDIPEGDPQKLAGLVGEAVAGLLEATDRRPGDVQVVFHGGLRLDLARLVCIALGEHLLHGYDIAATAAFPWPIDPEHARLVLFGYEPCWDRWVKEGASPGPVPYAMRFASDGEAGLGLTVNLAGGAPSDSGASGWTISADPVAFLLVGSGRISEWEAVALGLYRTEAARPEPAGAFVDLFTYP